MVAVAVLLATVVVALDTLAALAVAVEVAGQSKPAIVAEWLGLQFVG